MEAAAARLLAAEVARAAAEAAKAAAEDEVRKERTRGSLAIEDVMERAKLVVEPSAVVGIAAACQAAFKARPDLERVGVILSGGNFDLMNLANLLSVAES